MAALARFRKLIRYGGSAWIRDCAPGGSRARSVLLTRAAHLEASAEVRRPHQWHRRGLPELTALRSRRSRRSPMPPNRLVRLAAGVRVGYHFRPSVPRLAPGGRASARLHRQRSVRTAGGHSAPSGGTGHGCGTGCSPRQSLAADLRVLSERRPRAGLLAVPRATLIRSGFTLTSASKSTCWLQASAMLLATSAQLLAVWASPVAEPGVAGQVRIASSSTSTEMALRNRGPKDRVNGHLVGQPRSRRCHRSLE